MNRYPPDRAAAKPPGVGSAKQRPSTAASERDRLRPRRASPGPPVSTLLPALSPTIPAFRAIPCPEVTEPICRLPLPTLFYRPEAVHLGDLLRIWVRAGANRRNPTEIFKVPSTARGCNKKCYTLRQKPKPILSSKEFQGLGGLCRKDNSSQSFDGRLSVCSCCHD